MCPRAAGFFGASWLGAATIDNGNILNDDLGGNGKSQGALNIIYTGTELPPRLHHALHEMASGQPMYFASLLWEAELRRWVILALLS